MAVFAGQDIPMGTTITAEMVMVHIAAPPDLAEGDQVEIAAVQPGEPL
ncbi:MAG: hypothetical protein QMD04_14880 [Anaerolineales bacterium]|nr:hypothetical protein [Anaerolineales bacterium]